MPGIVGFAGLDYGMEEKRAIVAEMQELIKHNDCCAIEESYSDDDVTCGRVHIGVINLEPQPLSDNGIYIWLNGEFYNQEHILQMEGIDAKNDIELLSKCFLKNRSFEFLKEIDGIYSAVVYDSIAKKVYLLADRYGYSFIFWTIHNGCLLWASEVKAMLGVPSFKARIDEQAVKEFINIGFLQENRTWFEGVSLLPVGTVMTWDIREKTHDMYRYWWWDRIKPYSGNKTEDELAEEAGRLFIKAVEKRSKGPSKIGIPLSGGLDSRAVLAAMPDCGYTLDTMTIGEKGSIEIPIAEKVAKLKGANHHVYMIDSNNWLQKRLEGIWMTDGHKNLYHMHLIGAHKSMKEYFSVVLNGFGSYNISGGNLTEHVLNMKKTEFDVPIDKKTIASCYQCDEELIGSIDEYSDLNKIDFYFIQNGDRRFSNEVRYSSSLIQIRVPFYDNDFFEFCQSLPEAMKYEWKFYNKMLLKTFPEYFRNIPWSYTGVPISCSNIAEFKNKLIGRIKRRVSKGLCLLGLKKPFEGSICDYAELIRQAPARQFFEKLLFAPDALYKEHISADRVLDDWQRHLNGEIRSEMLCRYLTFEIWLQQVYNNKYKKWEED